MNNDKLALSLMESINRKEIVTNIGSIVDMGIERVLENNHICGIPFISTAISLYNIGNDSIKAVHIKKLAAFIDAFNNNTLDGNRLEKYRRKIDNNPEKLNQELEYVLILISRYIGYDKPRILGKLFSLYLDDKLEWDAFTQYAEVIDRFLFGDYETLTGSSLNEEIAIKNTESATILRLAALGLISETNNSYVQYGDNGHLSITPSSLSSFREGFKYYSRTEFGERFVELMNDC